jgi:hypothetical protein
MGERLVIIVVLIKGQTLVNDTLLGGGRRENLAIFQVLKLKGIVFSIE